MHIRQAWVMVLLCSLPCAAQTAFVLGCKGKWTSSQSGKPVREQQVLYAGDTIRGEPGSPSDAFLTLVFYNARHERRTLHCAGGVCESLHLPKATEASWFARAMVALDKLTHTETIRLEPTISRGSQGPCEAVLRVVDGELDFAPMLGDVAPGDYLAKLSRWQEGGTAQGPKQTTEIRWSPPSSQTLSALDVRAGLYRVEWRRKGDPTTHIAYARIANPVDYERMSSDFARFASETSLAMASDAGERAREAVQWRELRLRYLTGMKDTVEHE
jgi:hypothetical protein